MPTECNPALFDFLPVEGRQVVASFDGGAITSDAGALLLGQTDRALRLTERFAACFDDTRTAELVEHQVETMVMQRVVGIALGYEDLNDHDELRRDPVLAVLAGKLSAQRSDCAPLAGKSTLNRLAHLIHGISGNGWRVSRKMLSAFKDWVSKPSCPRQRIEPHPPCPTIRSRCLVFQRLTARS